MQEKKAISLIVLVITIIVMIILAGTMIAVLTGENSIIEQARKAKEENDMAQLKESAELIKSELMTGYYSGDRTKYDKQELLKDLNQNFEGSILSEDRVTTEDLAYDIIVDDKLNITVEKSEGPNIILITSTINESGEKTQIELKFKVPGIQSMDEHMLNYVDTVIYPGDDEKAIEQELLDIVNENSTEGEEIVIDDDARAEIMEFGKDFGATTYLQSAKMMLFFYTLESTNVFAAEGKILYPYMCRMLEQTEYQNEEDIENQILEITKYEGTFEEYLALDFGTKEEIVAGLEGTGYTYADFIKNIYIIEMEESEEIKKIAEKYTVNVKVSDGNAFDVNLLNGYGYYTVNADGTYVFEAETKDGKTGKHTVVVGDPNKVVNPYGPNDWEYAWTYADGVKSEMLTGGGEIAGDITVKFYKLNSTITLSEDIATALELNSATDNEYVMVVEGTGSMDNIGMGWQDYGILSDPQDIRFPLFVTKAIFCEGVTKISEMACWGFISLNDVKVSNDLAEIDDNAFNGCYELTNIDNLLDKITVMNSSFMQCTGLRELTIPSNIQVVNGLGKSGVTKVNILNGAITIDEGAFAECLNLESITIPSSVTIINQQAFENCEKLKSIEITGKVTRITWRSFAGCEALSSVVLPNTLEQIDGYAFSGCTSLQSINLPSQVTKIVDYAFYGCTALKSIKIESSKVTAIGNKAFMELAQGSTITVPTQAVADLFVDGTNYDSTKTTVVVGN